VAKKPAAKKGGSRKGKGGAKEEPLEELLIDITPTSTREKEASAKSTAAAAAAAAARAVAAPATAINGKLSVVKAPESAQKTDFMESLEPPPQHLCAAN
jgi:hypothetical protein